jgi:hypothetical protein
LKEAYKEIETKTGKKPGAGTTAISCCTKGNNIGYVKNQNIVCYVDPRNAGGEHKTPSSRLPLRGGFFTIKAEAL